MKIMADGALTSRTAALHQPFEDQATTGILIHEPDDLRRRIIRAHQGGWQVAVHAIGDRAIDLALDGLEEAQAGNPRPGARHRIEHCMIMTDSILDRLAAGGIVACAQPEFMHWLAHAYRQGLGPRAEKLMPYQTWLKRGIPFCFSSDQPVVPGDPITGWRAAVDRKGRDGTVLGAEEGLDPLTALRAFTQGSALATFDEAVGGLTPGKEARFVVLSLDPEEILDPGMKVVATSHQLLG
jgi:predicted amidohydrolase YtcJ